MATGDKLVTLDELKLVNDRVKPVTEGGTGATTPADARTNLGITPANIGAVAGNVFIRKTGNTGGKSVQIKRTASEQIFLIIGAVTNTVNNRAAIFATEALGSTNIYETTLVGSQYNPTLAADGTITLTNKRGFVIFTIISTHDFTIVQS